MSNRTAAASKAVRLAWEKEQMRVQEGKGTRDWTPEQQKDILTRGKAYDENGKAFEGHHMMSAECYPEYQGDFENIQFLSREEHFEAHSGSFQNPTHGYYDFVNKETLFFATDKFIPCKVIKLSNPIDISMLSNSNDKDSDNDLLPKESNPSEIFSSESPPLFPSDNTSEKIVTHQEEQPKGLIGKVRGALQKHPKLTKGIGFALGLAGAAFGAYEANKNSSSSNSNNNDSKEISRNNEGYDYSPDVSDSEPSPSVDETLSNPHSSPIEHEVTAHKQRYHTKNGIEWRDKDPYPRGGKKDE